LHCGIYSYQYNLSESSRIVSVAVEW